MEELGRCPITANLKSLLRRSFLPRIVIKLVMNNKKLTDYSRQTRRTGSTRLLGWKLREAKAKSSRVVLLAASGQPQLVAVRGKDSESLHELLSESPLNRLDLDVEGVQSPVREVEL